MRPGNSNKHIYNKDRRRQRTYNRNRRKRKKRISNSKLHRQAWNNRVNFDAEEKPDQANKNVRSVLNDYRDAATISKREYDLRKTPKGTVKVGDSFGTGEVWDHELQLYYRKRYD